MSNTQTFILERLNSNMAPSSPLVGEGQRLQGRCAESADCLSIAGEPIPVRDLPVIPPANHDRPARDRLGAARKTTRPRVRELVGLRFRRLTVEARAAPTAIETPCGDAGG